MQTRTHASNKRACKTFVAMRSYSSSIDLITWGAGVVDSLPAVVAAVAVLHEGAGNLLLGTCVDLPPPPNLEVVGADPAPALPSSGPPAECGDL
eukprot:5275636-Amphidinium_carterae.2